MNEIWYQNFLHIQHYFPYPLFIDIIISPYFKEKIVLNTASTGEWHNDQFSFVTFLPMLLLLCYYRKI